MKYIITFILAIVLVNSNFSCQQAKADEQERYYDHYSWEIKTFNGMEYLIFYADRERTSSYGAATHVVNLTKDALEVQLLRKKLAEKQ